MCVQIYCVLCVFDYYQMNSQCEYMIGQVYVLESSRLESLFTDKQFFSYKFLETRIIKIKARVLTGDAMTMEEWDY